MPTDDDLRTALAELERSASSVSQFADELRSSPELLTSAETTDVLRTAEELSSMVATAEQLNRDV